VSLASTCAEQPELCLCVFQNGTDPADWLCSPVPSFEYDVEGPCNPLCERSHAALLPCGAEGVVVEALDEECDAVSFEFDDGGDVPRTLCPGEVAAFTMSYFSFGVFGKECTLTIQSSAADLEVPVYSSIDCCYFCSQPDFECDGVDDDCDGVPVDDYYPHTCDSRGCPMWTSCESDAIDPYPTGARYRP
jgi:hypothetical protein